MPEPGAQALAQPDHLSFTVAWLLTPRGQAQPSPILCCENGSIADFPAIPLNSCFEGQDIF